MSTLPLFRKVPKPDKQGKYRDCDEIIEYVNYKGKWIPTNEIVNSYNSFLRYNCWSVFNVDDEDDKSKYDLSGFELESE